MRLEFVAETGGSSRNGAKAGSAKLAPGARLTTEKSE